LTEPELIAVEVSGGELTVARWGRGPILVVAVHGITASHRAWSLVAQLADNVTLLAPDLRGRGAGSSLPGPFGMAVHARDALAAADALGAERFVATGHSMGGHVVLELARRAPERVSGVVLVDGGLSAPLEPGSDPDRLLEAMLGPALARLRRTFESRDAYLDFWKGHPAFKETGCWNEHVEAYLDYDLTGEAPELRSRVSEEAVIEDGREVLRGGGSGNLAAISCPVSVVRAPRGLLNQNEPLISDALLSRGRRLREEGFEEQTVPDCNHYTLMFEDSKAASVARALEKVS
jgi:pimeloyl-ACP methyl ester carboxylesterase